MRLLIKYLDNYDKAAWGELSKASPDSAGYDLRAAITNDIILGPNEFILVPLGISSELPNNMEAQIRARSGLALRNGIGLVNGVGTIDADYRDEWGVILHNCSKKNFVIHRGDRIAQVVFNLLPTDLEFEVAKKLSTSKRKGGYGSTGVK